MRQLRGLWGLWGPTRLLCVLTLMGAVPILAVDKYTMDLAARYFRIMKANNVVLATCSSLNEQHAEIKHLNRNGFQVLLPGKKSVTTIIQQLDNSHRTGIIMQFDCQQSAEVLKTASLIKLMSENQIWLILFGKPASLPDLINYFGHYKPAGINVTKFLQLESAGIQKRMRMDQINQELNAKILQETWWKETEEVQKDMEYMNWLEPLTELEALVDSHVLLGFPAATGDRYDLYTLHRKTNHSALEVEAIGSTRDDYRQLQELARPNTVRRRDYRRTIIRAGCGLFFHDYFNRSMELPPRSAVTDHWALMTFELYKLIEEKMNFRMLIKCFDDYGWPINGQFTGLVGFMQRHNAEIAATGISMHNERMNAVDFVDGIYEFKLGLILRQPSLASVTNIFTLPFAGTVWAATCGLLLLTSLLIWWQLFIEKRLHRYVNVMDKRTFHVGDIISFMGGVVCQQGYSNLGVHGFGLKLSILVILFSSIFLFTSYTATIVALLQSPSSAINSLEDLAESAMGLGIEDLPYEKKFLKEDDHSVVKEIYKNKIAPHEENAFLNTSEGMKKVRGGQYGFQCELSKAYKLIGETFTETEKCGLTKLELFPSRLLGTTTAKKSPYKEMLAVNLRWLREVGMTDRAKQRFSYGPPKCNSRSGYSSVQVEDIESLIHFLTYAIVTSLTILILERGSYLMIKKFENYQKQPPKKAWTDSYPVWEFIN